MTTGENISEKDFSSIEAYLDNSMPEYERVEFEERLSSEPDLRKAVDEYKQLILGIETSGLKERLSYYHAETLSGNQKNQSDNNQQRSLFPVSSVIPYLIAASFLLLVALVGWWFIFQPSGHEKLFAKHFIADPGLITPMSSGNNFIFYDGMVDYKRGEYSRAISKWENLLMANPNNDTINYFIGVAYLAKSQPAQAIVHLEIVSGISESAFINEAWFYLGLANLKTGDLQHAREALLRSEMEKAAAALQDVNRKLN